MSVAKRVNAAWDRIEKWYKKNMPKAKLHKGASDKDIKALEKELKVTLPEDFKASLLRHDGVEACQWTKSELFSVEGLKGEWNFKADLAKEADSKPDEESEKIENVWWSPSWVPIDSDGGGNVHCIDLKPTKKGKVGQIIFFDHETGASGPEYDSFVDYLEAAASELEAGKYKAEDDVLEENDDYEGEDDEGEGEGEDDEEDEGEDGDGEDEEEEEKPKKSRKKVKKN